MNISISLSFHWSDKRKCYTSTQMIQSILSNLTGSDRIAQNKGLLYKCASCVISFTEYFSIYKVYIMNSEEIADSLLKYSLSIFIN
jgi:protein-arginine kinase activator protein McsA